MPLWRWEPIPRCHEALLENHFEGFYAWTGSDGTFSWSEEVLAGLVAIDQCLKWWLDLLISRIYLDLSVIHLTGKKSVVIRNMLSDWFPQHLSQSEKALLETKKCHFALARAGWSVRNKSVRIDYWACLQTGPLYPLLLNQVAAITQSSGIQWLLRHGWMREEKSAMERFTLPPRAPSLAPRAGGVDNEGSCESSSSVSTHQSFGMTIAISWGVPGWWRTQ